jgi:hypothetical protein
MGRYDNLITGKTARMPGDLKIQDAPKKSGRTRHTPGKMNKREAAYSLELESLKRAGQIHSWMFESVKLRLADRTWFTPDFCVVMVDWSLEFHECKGHWEDDARVKWKVVQEMYPAFRFMEIK